MGLAHGASVDDVKAAYIGAALIHSQRERKSRAHADFSIVNNVLRMLWLYKDTKTKKNSNMHILFLYIFPLNMRPYRTIILENMIRGSGCTCSCNHVATG